MKEVKVDGVSGSMNTNWGSAVVTEKILCDCEYSTEILGIPQICYMCLGSKHKVTYINGKPVKK